MVRESYDASSALRSSISGGPAGEPRPDFIADLEVSARAAVAHLERGIAATFGVSLLDNLVEPLHGDWAGMERAQAAWRAAAEANAQVAANYRDAATGTGGWEGEAADIYRTRLDRIAEQFSTYAEGCLMLSKVSESVLEVARGTATLIASEVNLIGERVEQVLIQSSFPEDKWTGSEVDMRGIAREFWERYGRAMDALRELASASRGAVSAMESVAAMLDQINATLREMSRGGAARP